MEIFIAYTDDDLFPILEQTMNAWGECDWAEVSAIQVKNNGRYEISRRVAADNLATGNHYMLVDLGCVPMDTRVIPQINRRLKDEDGYIGLWPEGKKDPEYIEEYMYTPEGVRICKKGVIQKWPSPSKNSSYDKMYAASVMAAGKHVEVWRDIFYKPLQAC